MKGKFALTLTNHRILGPLFNPVIILPSPNREYYTVSDRLSLANLKHYEPHLLPEETQPGEDHRRILRYAAAESFLQEEDQRPGSAGLD